MNRITTIFAAAIVCVGVGCSSQSSTSNEAEEATETAASGMKAPSDFEMIESEEARSRALFGEIGKVLTHPRCINCHPTGNRPMQGDEMLPHQPLVQRGKDNHGAPGMRCASCHSEENVRNVPGAPHWHMAPREMGWNGKSLRFICQQIKDPERNGGKSLDEIVEHMADDPLVAYGWNPPRHLTPVPGSQEVLGDLTRAWVDTGAHCPEAPED